MVKDIKRNAITDICMEKAKEGIPKDMVIEHVAPGDAGKKEEQRQTSTSVRVIQVSILLNYGICKK